MNLLRIAFSCLLVTLLFRTDWNHSHFAKLTFIIISTNCTLLSSDVRKHHIRNIRQKSTSVTPNSMCNERSTSTQSYTISKNTMPRMLLDMVPPNAGTDAYSIYCFAAEGDPHTCHNMHKQKSRNEWNAEAG